MKPDHDRINRISSAVAGANLDLLVCSLASNVLLLTGYWPVVGTSIAIATRGGKIALLAPEDEAELARRGWADPVRTFKPSPLDELEALPEVVFQPLQALINELGTGRGATRIGCDAASANEPATYAAMNIYGAELSRLLHKAAPGAHITGARKLLARLKAVLTSREIERVRLACRIAGEAFNAVARELRPGIEEIEIAARIEALLSTIGAGIPGVQRAGGFAWCMSGPNSAEAAAAYARSRARKIERGDLVLVHCNSYVDGLWTDITRTFVAGDPNTRQLKIQQAIAAARSAALNAIQPGARAAEVDGSARRILAEHGFGKEFKHSTGHGVGYVAIDANALPRLHPKSPDVLATGMVFNVEPAIYIDGYGGARHCDTVAVAHEGVEVLSDF